MTAAPSLPRATALWGTGHPLGRAARVLAVAGAFAAAVYCKIPLCPFALVTHHPCPGCGLTRAGLALLRGDLASAMMFHPLSPVMVPVVALALGYNAAFYVARGKWGAFEGVPFRWMGIFAGLLSAALFGVWIARFFGAFGGPVPV